MKINAYEYTVHAQTKICGEILQALEDSSFGINFHNFSENDFYYDNNGTGHEIEIDKSKKTNYNFLTFPPAPVQPGNRQ